MSAVNISHYCRLCFVLSVEDRWALRSGNTRICALVCALIVVICQTRRRDRIRRYVAFDEDGSQVEAMVLLSCFCVHAPCVRTACSHLDTDILFYFLFLGRRLYSVMIKKY
jgi:hypothetical protein